MNTGEQGLRGAGSLAGLGPALRSRARQWARRRQGKDPTTVRLTARRIYILPTGVGLVFALMAFAMLLGSLNYNNNLSFLLTSLLAALGFVAMHACQRNLVGLEIAFAGVEPVFAGEPARFRIAVTNPSRNARFRLKLYREDTQSEVMDLEAGESRIFVLPIVTARRGWLDLERFGIRTLYPFELFGAWAWLHMDIRALVYPRPAADAPPPPESEQSLGHRQHDARGEEDFAGLRRFVPGDSPRHVAWKAYARNEQLLSKRFAGADTSSQWFDFTTVDAAGTEQRLAILARWIVDADRAGVDYGLAMPDERIGPAHGEAHRHACLEALALYGVKHA